MNEGKDCALGPFTGFCVKRPPAIGVGKGWPVIQRGAVGWRRARWVRCSPRRPRGRSFGCCRLGAAGSVTEAVNSRFRGFLPTNYG